jgi:hypothetical protein
MVGVVLATCAHNPEPRAEADTMPPDSGAQAPGIPHSQQGIELRGRLVNGGTDRSTITTLVRSGSPPTRLGGALLHELRALSGADVLVRGVMDSSGADGTLDVREYEVLAIDGRRPHVGVVLARAGELWLAASDTLRLVPKFDALSESVGAKIWVVGTSDSTAGELRVESYGVIVPRP